VAAKVHRVEYVRVSTVDQNTDRLIALPEVFERGLELRALGVLAARPCL